MANATRPRGFVASRHLSGGRIRQTEYKLASGYATSIFRGDVVKLDTAGVIQRSAAGDTTNVGVFAGCMWTDVDGSYRFSAYWPGGTTVKAGTTPTALVYDDPAIVFSAITDGTTVFTQAMEGANADFVATAGSTVYGTSLESIDVTTTPPAAATANFRILRLVNKPGNAYDTYAEIEVVFNEHLFKSATGV